MAKTPGKHRTSVLLVRGHTLVVSLTPSNGAPAFQLFSSQKRVTLWASEKTKGKHDGIRPRTLKSLLGLVIA